MVSPGGDFIAEFFFRRLPYFTRSVTAGSHPQVYREAL